MSMRNLHIYLSALVTLYGGRVHAGHRSSHFRDLQAFPKFEVQFLNQLPIAESDAKRCLDAGIEQEEDWMTLRAARVEHKRIGDGDEIIPVDVCIPAPYIVCLKCSRMLVG
jgi:protein OS-9